MNYNYLIIVLRTLKDKTPFFFYAGNVICSVFSYNKTDKSIRY